MNSEEGITPKYKKSSESCPASDDEISVIAVIKKGTSGIPKRARYHYIRELPLTSVNNKSLKKSLHKSKDILYAGIMGQGTINENVKIYPEILSSTEETIEVINNNILKKPRVIELSDEISKMELRKELKMVEGNNSNENTELEEMEYPAEISLSSSIREDNIFHKLPPGTVLVKQELNNSKIKHENHHLGVFIRPEVNDNKNDQGSNNTTANNTSASSSNVNSGGSSTSTSSVSSCGGSGSSSGDFGSGSPSPKRLNRGTTRGGNRKKIADVVPRRNPKRSGSKKSTTISQATTTTTTSTTTRPRLRRLLATRRQERTGNTIGETVVTGRGNNRRIKPPTMPYMNTRSVTRKLYTVGATYQAPTKKDETEWRDWPTHGMHERPVFHPEIGVAAGYAGRVFWSTSDSQGLNWTYREVLDVPEEVEIVPVDPRPNLNGIESPGCDIKTVIKSSQESFEVCMHDSLHTVLGYCAQVMTPSYREMVEKKLRCHDLDYLKTVCDTAGCEKLILNSDEKLLYEDIEIDDNKVSRNDLNQLSQLEDSSISDETLMEISSIYKKLLPIDEQPSSREGSPEKCIEKMNDIVKNKIIDIPKNFSFKKKQNSNETSEIARILSEYNESLKETNFNRPFSSTIPAVTTTLNNSFEVKDSSSIKERRNPEELEIHQTGKTVIINDGAKVEKNEKKINDDNNNNWLEELLVDTSLLYCIATGTDHRDFTEYLDTLDANESLLWLKRRLAILKN